MSNETTAKNLFAGKTRTVAAVAAFSGLALATTVSVQATQNADEQAPAATVSEAPASENTVSAEPAAKADKAQEKKAEKVAPAAKTPAQPSVVQVAPVADVTPLQAPAAQAPAATQVVPAAQTVTPVAEQAPAQGRHAAQPTQQTLAAENTARQDAQVYTGGTAQAAGYQGPQQTGGNATAGNTATTGTTGTTGNTGTTSKVTTAGNVTPQSSTPAPKLQAKAASHASASGQGGAILSAAEGQLGEYQDCTQLVSDSLAAVGIHHHGWPASYKSLGTPVSAADAKAGDIAYYANGGSGMAHVAIYAGNGQAIHGGWNGNQTVKTSAYVGSGPEFIRVG